MDDVTAAAADVLVPIASSLVNVLSSSDMSALRDKLWHTLARDDDLSAATASILHLLWKLYSTDDSETVSTESLSVRLPLLFPFLAHPLASVRTSAMHCLNQLLSFSFQFRRHLLKIGCLIFFNLLTEVKDDILQLNKETWKTLMAAYKATDLVQDFNSGLLMAMVKLATTPIGAVFEKEALETLIDTVGDHSGEKLTVGSQCAGNAFRMRFAVCQALALLFRRLPNQLHVLSAVVLSDSATAILVYALIGHFWCLQNTVNPSEALQCPLASQSVISEMLERAPAFSELHGYETKLRKEYATFLQELAIQIGSDVVTGHVHVETLQPEEIESQATTLLLSAGASVYDCMAGLHQQVVTSSRKLSELRQVLKIQVHACIAAVLVDKAEIPSKLNCVVQPLMAGIRTEKENILQMLFATQLARLIVLCHKRKAAVQKMIGNVCLMACDKAPLELEIDLCQAIEKGGIDKALGVIAMEGMDHQTVSQRGAASVLHELTRKLSVDLFTTLPALWTEMTEGLGQSPSQAVHCIEVVQTVVPGLAVGLLPQTLPLLNQISNLCFSQEAALRVAASRCCARLALAHTEVLMPHILEQLVPFLSVQCDTVQREGAIIALYHTLEALGLFSNSV